METRFVDYRDAEGRAYRGFLAIPDKPNGAGALVAHGATGMSDHERGSAEKLAELGYVALTVDYYGGGDKPEMARIEAMMADTKLLRTPMAGALEALKAQAGVDQNRLAVIGYCMGGAAAFELACTGADVKAAVGFHSILPDHPEDCRAIKGAVLMLQGAADPYVQEHERAAFERNLNAAGKDWRMIIFGGAEHAFTMENAASFNKPGIVYHAPTAKRSWRAMLDALAESVGV